MTNSYEYWRSLGHHTAPRTGDPQCLGIKVIKVKKAIGVCFFVPQPEVVLLIPLSSLASLETDRCILSQLGCLCQSCVTACFVPQDETRAERLLRFACNCDSHLTAANIQCNVTSFGLQLLAVIFQLFQFFLRFQSENTKRLRKGGPRRLFNRRQMLKISIADKTGLQNNQFEECQGQGATTAGKLVSRHVLLHFFSSNPVNRSLCAFCREVVPTKPFTNTALYYKMMLESEPTPLLQNGLGVFMMDQKPMSVTTKWLYATIL